MQKTDDCFPWCFSASFAVTFAGSHETHENGPLRPRRLPGGSSPVSDGWRLCGALWRGWRIESPLDIRGGGGRASERPRVRPLPASGGSVRSRWCFFAAFSADGLPSLPRFRPCRVDLAGVGVAVLTASVPAASGRRFGGFRWRVACPLVLVGCRPCCVPLLRLPASDVRRPVALPKREAAHPVKSASLAASCGVVGG